MEGWSSVDQEDWCFGDEVALIQQKKTKLEKICKLLTKKAPLRIRLSVKGMRNGGRGKEKGYMRLEEEEGKTEGEKMKTEVKGLSLNQWRTGEEWEIKERKKRKRIYLVGEKGKKENKEDNCEMERDELMVDEIKVRDGERKLEERESILKLTVIQRMKKEMYDMERSGRRDVERWKDWIRAQRESLKEKLSKKIEERTEGKRKEKAAKKMLMKNLCLHDGQSKERRREREDRTLKMCIKNVMQQMKETHEKKKRDLQKGEQRERQRKTELKRVIQQQRQREERNKQREEEEEEERTGENNVGEEIVEEEDQRKMIHTENRMKEDLLTNEIWADEDEDTREGKQKHGEEKLCGEYKAAIKEIDNIWTNFRPSWFHIGNSLVVIWARSDCNLQSGFFTLLQPSQADIGIHCHKNGNQCVPHYIACQRQSKAQTKYCNKAMKGYQRLQMQSLHPK